MVRKPSIRLATTYYCYLYQFYTIEQMRGLDQDLWDNKGGFDVDILKNTRRWVYKTKQSKNAKEKKDMTEAQIKQKRQAKKKLTRSCSSIHPS